MIFFPGERHCKIINQELEKRNIGLPSPPRNETTQTKPCVTGLATVWPLQWLVAMKELSITMISALVLWGGWPAHRNSSDNIFEQKPNVGEKKRRDVVVVTCLRRDNNSEAYISVTLQITEKSRKERTLCLYTEGHYVTT